MEKRNALIPVVGIALFMALCVMLLKPSGDPEQQTAVSASWSGPNYESVEEMAEDADLTINGKVKDRTAELRGGLIFTRNIIEVTEVYKGEVEVGDSIELLQTGGELDGRSTYPFDEIPLLKDGKTYAMFLTLTPPDERYGQYYLILGGYKGIAKLDERGYMPLSGANAGIVKKFSGYFD